MTIPSMAPANSEMGRFDSRAARFSVMRAFRMLCTARGYSSAEVQRRLGGQDLVSYQTVAGWGVNSARHRRQTRNTPSAYWLGEIVRKFPEIADGVYVPTERVTPEFRVVQVTRGVPRGLMGDVIEEVRGSLRSYLLAGGSLDRPWRFSTSPSWRRPTEHFTEMNDGLSPGGVPIHDLRLMLQQLGVMVVVLPGTISEKWFSVLEIRVTDRANPIPLLALGGTASAAETRAVMALALGFFLIGAAADGNAKRAAAQHFADELLVPTPWLRLWIGKAKTFTRAQVDHIAEGIAAPVENVVRQCERSEVIVIPGGKVVRSYFEHLALLS